MRGASSRALVLALGLLALPARPALGFGSIASTIKSKVVDKVTTVAAAALGQQCNTIKFAQTCSASVVDAAGILGDSPNLGRFCRSPCAAWLRANEQSCKSNAAMKVTTAAVLKALEECDKCKMADIVQECGRDFASVVTNPVHSGADIDAASFPVYTELCNQNSKCMRYFSTRRCSAVGVAGVGMLSSGLGSAIANLPDTVHKVCSADLGGQGGCTFSGLLQACPDSTIFLMSPTGWTQSALANTCGRSSTCSQYLSSHSYCKGSPILRGMDVEKACRIANAGGCTYPGLNAACKSLSQAGNCKQCTDYLAQKKCSAANGTTPASFIEAMVTIANTTCNVNSAVGQHCDGLNILSECGKEGATIDCSGRCAALLVHCGRHLPSVVSTPANLRKTMAAVLKACPLAGTSCSCAKFPKPAPAPTSKASCADRPSSGVGTYSGGELSGCCGLHDWIARIFALLLVCCLGFKDVVIILLADFAMG